MKYVDDAKKTKYEAATRVIYTDAQAYTADMIKKYGTNKETYQYVNCDGVNKIANFDSMVDETFSCNAKRSAEYEYEPTIISMYFDQNKTITGMTLMLKKDGEKGATVIIQANGTIEVK